MFTTRFEAWVRRHAEALIAALGRTPLTPNQVTVLGLALTFIAAGLIAFGQLRWAGVVLIFAGTCDILDGALARTTGASYPYGAFLDSTLDRYSEGVVYLGLAAYFVSTDGPLQRRDVRDDREKKHDAVQHGTADQQPDDGHHDALRSLEQS